MVLKPLVLALLASLGLLLAAAHLRGAQGPAPRAATALRMDLEELVDRSDLIVEGRVLAAHALRDDQGRVLTEYELSVERTLEGLPTSFRTLRLPGGAMPDGRITLVPGLPTLTPGEEVVLLLTGEGPNGVRVPVGLSQGKFHLRRTTSGARVAVREHADVQLQVPGTGVGLEGGGDAMEHVELIARLNAAVADKHARGIFPGEDR